MKQFLRTAGALIAAVAIVALCYRYAAAGPGVQGDACQNYAAPKQAIPVSVATATTTLMVTGVAGYQAEICNYAFTLAGTTPTAEFEAGTGATCGTNTVAIGGTMAPTSGTLLQDSGQGILMTAPAGDNICLVTTGTGASAQGNMNYVLQ